MAIKVVYTMPVGNITMKIIEVDGLAAYVAATGHVLTAAQLGNFNRIHSVQPHVAVVRSTQAPANLITVALKANRAEQGCEAATLFWATTVVGGTNSDADYSLNQTRLIVMGY